MTLPSPTYSTPPFSAFRIHQEEGTVAGRLESITLDDVNPGEVVLRVAYSDVNYKDALAATGTGKILRRFPLVGGIDLAGHVVASSDPRFSPGDEALVVGCGLSETRDGGYSEYARVRGDDLVSLPDGLGLREAMAIGTAGFTAALAVERMEQNGQTPALGPVLVTGATGGVGSIAIDLLQSRGYSVAALTGKASAAAYLKGLGASEVVLRDGLEMGQRPLEKAHWGGAIDNLGGDILGWLTRTVQPRGNIASIGLAAGVELQTTVLPFILRGVSLLGIHSVQVPDELRRKVWARLATDLRPRHLDAIITREVTLEELPGVFQDYVGGKVTGRTVVRISG